MAKVGIPRGLYYYKYHTLWETFFTELGAEIVVSGETNKNILVQGANSCVSEACLPIKIYFGHVLDLIGKADYIFMPRFTSISQKQYICPEVCGVPDMVRNTLKDMPQIIDTEINLRNSKKNSWEAALHTGEFITGDKKAIKRAYEAALQAYKANRQQIKAGSLSSDTRKTKKQYNGLTIAVMGHSYTVYDRFINMELLKKLTGRGIHVITLDMLDYQKSREGCSELDKMLFWDYGTRAYGGAVQLVNNGQVDGILVLTSFGCGVDSMVDEMVENKIRQDSDIPFMKLVLDEHSAEAGFMTRLEAFIDMIVRRRENGNNLSSLGKHLYRC